MAIVYQANTTAADSTELSTLSPTTGTNVISPISGADARIRGDRISRRSTPTPESNGITNESYSTANYIVTWPMWLVALETGTGAFFRNWARHASAGNAYAVQWFDGTLSLRAYTGGSPTTLGTYTWSSPATATVHNLVLELNGTSLTVKLGGSTVIGPVTDSTYTSAGQVGFSIFGTEDPATTGWRIGAFTVDTITGGGSSTRRRTVLRGPKNTQRAFKPQSRMVFGATRLAAAPLPPDYYVPRNPTVSLGPSLAPTVTRGAALSPTVTITH